MTETRKRELQAELDGMTVHLETMVGWDENTPPNETLDQYGNLLASNRGVVPVPDNRSPKRRVYDDPGVEALRAHLREHNGIRGLEICDPSEVKRADSDFPSRRFRGGTRPAQPGAARALESGLR